MLYTKVNITSAFSRIILAINTRWALTVGDENRANRDGRACTKRQRKRKTIEEKRREKEVDRGMLPRRASASSFSNVP